MKLNFSNCHVVVVGDVMLDVYFLGQVQRLSPEAPVPIVHVKEKNSTLGGAGNTALNLVALGCQTTLIGVHGDDLPGKQLVQLLKERGVSSGLIMDRSHPTTTKTRIIGQGQQLLRLDEEKAWKGSNKTRKRLLKIFKEAINTADAVVLSDYQKGIFSGDVCKTLIDLCRNRDIPVFVDPKGRDWQQYQNATCITPNTAEVELVCKQRVKDNEAQLIHAARSLHKNYTLQWLLVTRGPNGMCLIDPKGSPALIPATAKEVYDVSGAGDTVIAVLAAGVAAGLSFPESAKIANIAAGIVVGKLGSQAINLPELEAGLKISAAGSEQIGISKIVTLDNAQIQVKAWKANSDKIVFTNGCFDLLHAGHIHILNQAKEAGDRLIIGLNTDTSIKSIKGTHRPIISEQDRANVLSALGCVDLIILFKEDTPLRLIEAIQPDVLVKGADYTIGQVVGHDIVQAYGGDVRLIPLLKGYSTTDIVEKLTGAHP